MDPQPRSATGVRTQVIDQSIHRPLEALGDALFRHGSRLLFKKSECFAPIQIGLMESAIVVGGTVLSGPRRLR
jgi:hypothetical protein